MIGPRETNKKAMILNIHEIKVAFSSATGQKRPVPSL